jgi:hypothetical protein
MDSTKNQIPPLFDEGLQDIFGSRYTDATAEPAKKEAPAPAAKPAKPVKAAEPVKAEKIIDKAVAAQWEPARPDPNWLDRLKACAKWALTFGALCCVFFYLQQTGLMDPTAALPSMLTCTLLAGWGVGKHATK